MMKRWRFEIEQGRAMADAFGERMRSLVWLMLKQAFGIGLVIGALIGGIFVWLTT